MEKASMLLAAAALLASTVPASAVDFKARGEWIMSFELGQHGAFTGGNGLTGYSKNDEDTFEARQRLRLQLDAVASESLSGTVVFEIGDQLWGGARDGAALGADGSVLEVKHAYLDWMLPATDIRTRMGLQEIVLPGFTAGTQVLADDMAAINASWKLNDNIQLTAFWARLYNDNATEETITGRHYHANYNDNVDSAGLILPLSFEGFHITPWAMYTALGPHAFREGNDPWAMMALSQLNSGMLPAGGATHHERLSSYGNAFWAGLTGEIVAWEPFRLAWDANYGSVSYDDASANRSGWLASLLLEYRLDWVTPGLYGWYGSGDDSDHGDGSERMPYLSLNSSDNDFSPYAFAGNPAIGREGSIGWSMAGTWGVGVRLKDISVVEDVRQTLRVNFLGGTNTPAAGRWLCATGLAPNSGAFGTAGMDGLYLTTNDYALEVALSSVTRIYENMTVGLEASYIALWLDKDIWGHSRMNGQRDNVRDAWNVNFIYKYAF